MRPLRAMMFDGTHYVSLDKVIKCTVYCTDAAHFQAINSVYARYFPSSPPARGFICVSAWHGPFDVEIDCVATI